MALQKIYFWLQQKDRIVYLIYSALALVVLLPLFKSGYVLAMDMVFVPHLAWPESFNVPGAFLYLLNYILPSQVIQKVLLFLVLFLSGIGMHRLVPVKSEWSKYFAGFLYVFNPFVYSRFLFGHLWILMAYALTPFVVKSIFEFFNKVNFKNALKLSLWLVLIGFLSSHFIVFVFLFFAIASLVYLWKSRKMRKEIFKIFKYTILVGLIFLIFSSWWIVPFFNISSPRGQYVQEVINEKDFETFQTEPDAKYGVLLNVAALYGFWGDRMGQYAVPKDVIPYWFPLFLVIFGLVILGTINTFRQNKYKAIIFSTIAVIAFVLSVGIAYQPFASTINFLSEKVFLFKGFRDSQKFTALLVLVYSYFGAIGVNYILNLKIKKLESVKVLLMTFFIALPILYSPLMVWGFKGQLQASDYPEEWFEVNEILNQDQNDFKTLFLPWHFYMSFSFTNNRVIFNPASIFFDKETIAGDNMELGKIYTRSAKPISQFIENKVLSKRNEIDNLGELLLPFDIKYIILAKEVDWPEYDFLNKQKDLEVIYDLKYIKLYQNKGWE